MPSGEIEWFFYVGLLLDNSVMLITKIFPGVKLDVYELGFRPTSYIMNWLIILMVVVNDQNLVRIQELRGKGCGVP
jgi:hypothetical protein